MRRRFLHITLQCKVLSLHDSVKTSSRLPLPPRHVSCIPTRSVETRGYLEPLLLFFGVVVAFFLVTAGRRSLEEGGFNRSSLPLRFTMFL